MRDGFAGTVRGPGRLPPVRTAPIGSRGATDEARLGTGGGVRLAVVRPAAGRGERGTGAACAFVRVGVGLGVRVGGRLGDGAGRGGCLRTSDPGAGPCCATPRLSVGGIHRERRDEQPARHAKAGPVAALRMGGHRNRTRAAWGCGPASGRAARQASDAVKRADTGGPW